MRKKELNLIVTLVSITVVLVSGCSRVGNSNGIVENKNTLVKKELVYAATTELGDINVHLYAGEMIAQDMVFEPLIDNTPECPALYGAAVPQRILRCDEPRLRIPLRRLSGYIFDEA